MASHRKEGRHGTGEMDRCGPPNGSLTSRERLQVCFGNLLPLLSFANFKIFSCLALRTSNRAPGCLIAGNGSQGACGKGRPSSAKSIALGPCGAAATIGQRQGCCECNPSR